MRCMQVSRFSSLCAPILAFWLKDIRRVQKRKYGRCRCCRSIALCEMRALTLSSPVHNIVADDKKNNNNKKKIIEMWGHLRNCPLNRFCVHFYNIFLLLVLVLGPHCKGLLHHSIGLYLFGLISIQFECFTSNERGREEKKAEIHDIHKTNRTATKII